MTDAIILTVATAAQTFKASEAKCHSTHSKQKRNQIQHESAKENEKVVKSETVMIYRK